LKLDHEAIIRRRRDWRWTSVRFSLKVVAEYALRDVYALCNINKPVGISKFRLDEALPQTLRGALPTRRQFSLNLALPVSSPMCGEFLTI